MRALANGAALAKRVEPVVSLGDPREYVHASKGDKGGEPN